MINHFTGFARHVSKLDVYKINANLTLAVDAELARVKSVAFNYLNTHLKNEANEKP